MLAFTVGKDGQLLVTLIDQSPKAKERLYVVERDGGAYWLARVDGTSPSRRVEQTRWGWRCDCPDARYRGRQRSCNHVLAVAQIDQLLTLVER